MCLSDGKHVFDYRSPRREGKRCCPTVKGSSYLPKSHTMLYQNRAPSGTASFPSNIPNQSQTFLRSMHTHGHEDPGGILPGGILDSGGILGCNVNDLGALYVLPWNLGGQMWECRPPGSSRCRLSSREFCLQYISEGATKLQRTTPPQTLPPAT